MDVELVPIFKGNGNPLNPNSYRRIKLLEHAFKLNKKILDGCLPEVVDIDTMQYGFMPGRGTVVAVFVLRRLTEKFRATKKKLFFIYLLTWKRLFIGYRGKLFVLL